MASLSAENIYTLTNQRYFLSEVNCKLQTQMNIPSARVYKSNAALRQNNQLEAEIATTTATMTATITLNSKQKARNKCLKKKKL